MHCLPEDSDGGRDEILGSDDGFARDGRRNLHFELRDQVAHTSNLCFLLLREVSHTLARFRVRAQKVLQCASLAANLSTLGLCEQKWDDKLDCWCVLARSIQNLNGVGWFHSIDNIRVIEHLSALAAANDVSHAF